MDEVRCEGLLIILKRYIIMRVALSDSSIGTE